MGIKLEGLGELKAVLQSSKYRRKAQNILRENAAQLQDGIKTNMSKKYTGHYEGKKFVKPTGATSRSVTIAYTNGGMEAHIGPHTKYAPYLEYGTRFMSARPTVGPATRKQGPIFIQQLEKVIDDD